MKKRSISLLAGLCMLTSTLVPLNLYQQHRQRVLQKAQPQMLTGTLSKESM